MNKIILSGNIVEDVTFNKTTNGTYYLKNKLAVQDNAKTEYEETYFIPIKAFSKDVLKTFKDFKKGKLIEVDGKLVHRNYKKENKWYTFTEVIVFNVKEVTFNKKDTNLTNINIVNDDDLPF